MKWERKEEIERSSQVFHRNNERRVVISNFLFLTSSFLCIGSLPILAMIAKENGICDFPFAFPGQKNPSNKESSLEGNILPLHEHFFPFFNDGK